MNQPNTRNNTHFGLGKTLTMNKDEVEEDPSEDEGTEAFTIEGTKAFEDKGTEAFVEEGTDALQRKVQFAAHIDQGRKGSFERISQKLMKIKFEMPTQEILKHNPCCMQMLQNLVKLKTPLTTAEWILLYGDYHTNTKADTNIKINDPGSFNVPISINGMFLGNILCYLGAKINLMSLTTFRKIEGLMMIPTDKLVRVADGTEEEPEGVMLDVKVVVEDYEFLADIVVMDIPECPVTLGKPFLATAQVRINLEYKEIVLKAKSKYLVHHISQDNIRKDESIEFHAMEDVDPYKSDEDMEQSQAYQEKYEAANTSTDVREGATGGS